MLYQLLSSYQAANWWLMSRIRRLSSTFMPEACLYCMYYICRKYIYACTSTEKNQGSGYFCLVLWCSILPFNALHYLNIVEDKKHLSLAFTFGSFCITVVSCQQPECDGHGLGFGFILPTIASASFNLDIGALSWRNSVWYLIQWAWMSVTNDGISKFISVLFPSL
jgi:hypothetical protein